MYVDVPPDVLEDELLRLEDFSAAFFAASSAAFLSASSFASLAASSSLDSA